MSHYRDIELKLAAFIKKYYYNQLLKGSIISLTAILGIGLVIATLEFFLWLNSTARLILLITSSALMIFILARWVLKPILKLAKIAKGIDFYKASTIIGQHFKAVDDKLTNILQLKEQGASNDFIIASIEQKSQQLKSVPFQLAVDFKYNLKYLRFAVIPMLVILAIWISGQGQFFSDSYYRVANYQKEFEPPAPFQFFILNQNLEVNAGDDFTLISETRGKLKPEEIYIHLNDQKFQLKSMGDGTSQFTLQNLTKSTRFYLSANNYNSQTYEIKVFEIPQLKGLQLALSFPAYTQLQSKTQTGTGNATIPEGTKVKWQLTTAHTDRVNFYALSDSLLFKADQDYFSYSKTVLNTLKYQLSTSNQRFSNFETLNYELKVVKDQFPQINLQFQKDSIERNQMYFFAKISDDYGLRKAELVYVNTTTDSTYTKPIGIAKNSFGSFNYAFPNPELSLKPGETYRYFFKVYDNDGVNGSKSAQSKVFYYNKPSKNEAKKQNLQEQKETIEQLNKSLAKTKAEQKEMSSLKQISKEKQQLNYTDKEKLKSFVERQKQQMELMKSYSDKLNKQLKEYDSDSDKKQALQERLEQNQKQQQQNEKLLEELQKLQDKINEDNLDNSLEEFDKEQKKQKQSLEQLLELTKRFYVEEKQKQIADELKTLAEKQEKLSEDADNSSDKQKKLSEEFKAVQEDIDALEEQNKDLEKPMEIGADKFLEENIKQDQKTAEEELTKEESQESSGQDEEQNANSEDEEKGSSAQQKAQKAQQSAAKQMQQLSQKMQQSMMSGGMQQQAEDAEMLAQILDNLIVYSIEQEQLMNDFSNLSNKNPLFAAKLRRQAELRENFKHIDDSLFELAKRNMMITEVINNSIEEIKFNTEKALEHLAENKVEMGNSYQQYIMKDANTLANLLSNSLNQMQMSGSGQGQGGPPKPGQGQGSGQQLSDIIKSHEELAKAMKAGQQKGQKSGEKSGEKPGDKSGKSEGEGEKGEGKQGKNGESGQKGDNGQGQSGQSDAKTQNGQDNGGLENSQEIYKIFKQQQQLRQQLEDKIKSLGLDANSRALEKSLDNLEKELLMKGFTNALLQRMASVKHQLLKLEEAANEQGQNEKRQAETNTTTFTNSETSWREKSKEYFNSTELLNRQQLPLQPKFKALIELYFKTNND